MIPSENKNATGELIDNVLRTALDAGASLVDVTKRLIFLEVADRGRALKIPVIVQPYETGENDITVLTDEVARATNLAREQRLLDAAGPDRRIGTAQLQSIKSFVGHVNRYKDEGTAVWANAKARQLVAVLDYHRAGPAGETRWGSHRSIYDCPLSEAWAAWGAGKAKLLSQDDLAKLLDTRDYDLAEGTIRGAAAPTPSALITMANDLETYSDTKAKRERDDTGRMKVSFSSETGIGGAVRPPPRFLIKIRIFEDGAPEELEMRLRVEVSKEGKATFEAQIHDADNVLRRAFELLIAEVQTDTQVPVFIGTPEGTTIPNSALRAG